jgi:ABC-type bacteriocin/lantibiotic exporter with double-glycine peptidase domain
MINKPPYFAQETEYSCAVACLRMVLAAQGIERTEEELRALCDCGEEGTHALKLIDAARQLGFANSRKHNLTIDELVAELNQEQFPIVFVRTRISGNPIPTQHAYVITEVKQESVSVLDPWQGEREIAIGEFEREWRQMLGLTILCRK